MTQDVGDNPLRIVFGKNVRRLRRALDLSQAELAERTGIHRAYLSTVENGKRNVSIDNIFRLAAALGTDASSLLIPDKLDSSGEEE